MNQMTAPTNHGYTMEKFSMDVQILANMQKVFGALKRMAWTKMESILEESGNCASVKV